ncbi:MAG: bifunctional phosphoribosylaminoimidazolecarboxamide formyltransferase/IMP cyclohydrolase [Puniceicoccales bacterium]|jgi:phosphoribosylaminoimidazolecarboxamide formyltransferase/IMP cyclohydrolase|nr:bifunctional phosphoribosylaminoimidazolecarboxamide formyltransferase/IMP cyclohydrolase [Puniceicoccales bacterium]
MASKYALLSVSDKSGLASFARALVEKHGYVLLSTGGTARALRDSGLPVTDVSEHTGSPEIMEGRVKTLHPMIHGGLLCRRDRAEHLAQAAEHGIALIDIVAVNLYPFEATVANPDCPFEDAIENIDIGGPSMLRSAAKNHAAVTVITDPADYGRVLDSLDSADGESLSALRRELALKVFNRTAAYDAAIANYLDAKLPENAGTGAGPSLPSRKFNLNLPLAQPLRYGENPHQRAALYGSFHDVFQQIQGRELSYNNILDITAAARLVAEFDKPTLAILKHTNPCGVASATNLLEAWNLAFETDKQAPFGGIITANREVDAALATAIAGIFSEVIIAPGFAPEALAILAKKKNLRLIRSTADAAVLAPQIEVRAVVGGILAQDADNALVDRAAFKVATKRAPTEAEWEALLFGWRVVRHVKSNAIVYAGQGRTLGIGAGQMSRVDSSRIAVWKAGEAGLSLKGSVVASDAFFPFADGLVAAADAGATAAIQPGGSMRDAEVIAAADARGLAMVFTGVRHFRH